MYLLLIWACGEVSLKPLKNLVNRADTAYLFLDYVETYSSQVERPREWKNYDYARCLKTQTINKKTCFFYVVCLPIVVISNFWRSSQQRPGSLGQFPEPLIRLE